jgi:hypothetical protein
MPLAERRGKRHASHAPAPLQSEVSRSVPSPDHAPGDDEAKFSQGVVSLRVPGLVTERANWRNPAPAAAAALHPAATPKRFLPLHPLKSVLVSRPPSRTVCNCPHAHPITPALRSELQTDRHWKGGAVEPPNSFNQEAQNCPIQGMANDGRRADAPYFTRERDGGWYWRETVRPLYSPSAPVNVLLALSPLRSTLTVLAEPGDFALRFRAGNTAKNRRAAAGKRMPVVIQ